jgi:aspartyl-tRNA synthetase
VTKVNLDRRPSIGGHPQRHRRREIHLYTGVGDSSRRAELIERHRRQARRPPRLRADTAKIVHKVLGELRLKMAKDMQLKPSTEFAWVWVVNFPLFEHDERRSASSPRTTPSPRRSTRTWPKLDSGDRATVESIKSKAYDIVVNGSEIGGGSIRIHRMDVQQKVFALLGIDAEPRSNKFGFLLDALQYGAPPHGGIALGLDRLIMILRGTDQHPRRDRLPQDPERRGPDVREIGKKFARVATI